MGPRAVGHKEPPPKPQTYLRFVCFAQVEGARCRLGVFQAIKFAQENSDAPNSALRTIGELYDWFCDHLPIPKRRFVRGVEGEQVRLSWFKDSATVHVSRMFELKAALEDCGVHVEMIRTRAPGRIVYRDDFQVLAEPLDGRF